VVDAEGGEDQEQHLPSCRELSVKPEQQPGEDVSRRRREEREAEDSTPGADHEAISGLLS